MDQCNYLVHDRILISAWQGLSFFLKICGNIVAKCRACTLLSSKTVWIKRISASFIVVLAPLKRVQWEWYLQSWWENWTVWIFEMRREQFPTLFNTCIKISFRPLPERCPWRRLGIRTMGRVLAKQAHHPGLCPYCSTHWGWWHLSVISALEDEVRAAGSDAYLDTVCVENLRLGLGI